MKVGDRVKMNNKGEGEWSNNPHNPHGMTGTVDKLGTGWTGVLWDNGNHNSYQAGQLELVQAKVAKPLRVKKTKAGTYSIKGLTFEQLKALGIILGVQSGKFGSKTSAIYNRIHDEVEKTDPDFGDEYLYININLDNMKKGE